MEVRKMLGVNLNDPHDVSQGLLATTLEITQEQHYCDTIYTESVPK